MPGYEPLNSTRKEITSLILQPLTSGNGLQCTTSTISLLESSEFEALSYVSGDASIQETITFNDVPTQVTKNLYTAFKYLRHPDKPRYLWVDALCIDQKDIKEPNQQVSMMGDVYTSAKPVLVLLSEADQGSDEAFSLLPEALADSEIQEVSQTLFSLYMQLVEREYTLFGAWQKIAMIEFSKMGMVIYPAKNQKPDGTHGLLGMLPPSLRSEFTVDFARPLGAVFAEAVAHIFRHGKGAFLLPGMDLTGPSSDPTFSSWVPRFGDKMLLKPTRFHPPGIGASGAGADAVNGSVDQYLKTLRIRGLPIDDDCLRKLPRIEELANRARELALVNSLENAEVRPYLAPFKTKEPLWRTLITNKAYSGGAREVAPDSYGEMLCLLNILKGNCFFITTTGFCGIDPDSVEKWDQLVILFGAPAPFVLRDIGVTQADDREGADGKVGCNVSCKALIDGRHSSHGCNVVAKVVAYVAGVMDGEVVGEVYCEDLEDDVGFVVR
ncbi:heterokaryon incompatibility protein-domain-containing protein [Leptodontidium sp. MPI-SDFR-AT-0119]|nr:heterokaryon incompatibility protein-domain-containing protein [Leptodontidium sp. MPI-SDFR-AT-0119]